MFISRDSKYQIKCDLKSVKFNSLVAFIKPWLPRLTLFLLFSNEIFGHVLIENQIMFLLIVMFLIIKGRRKSAANRTPEGCSHSAAASWIWIA